MRRILKSNPKTKKLIMSKCNELNMNFHDMIKDFTTFVNYAVHTKTYTNSNLIMLWELYTSTFKVEDSENTADQSYQVTS